MPAPKNNPVGTTRQPLPQGLQIKTLIRPKDGKCGLIAAQGALQCQGWRSLPVPSKVGTEPGGRLRSGDVDPSLRVLGAAGERQDYRWDYGSPGGITVQSTLARRLNKESRTLRGCLHPWENHSYWPCLTFSDATGEDLPSFSYLTGTIRAARGITVMSPYSLDEKNVK